MEGSLETTHLNLLLLWIGKLSSTELEGQRAPGSPGLVVVPRFRIQVSKLPVQALITLAFHFLILFHFSPALFYFSLYTWNNNQVQQRKLRLYWHHLSGNRERYHSEGKRNLKLSFYRFPSFHVKSFSLEKTENWLEKERATKKKKLCRII